MTTEELHSYKDKDKEIEIVPWLHYQPRLQPRSQKIETQKAVMKQLEKPLKCEDVLLATEIKIIHTIVFPITAYGCESWIIKKTGRKKVD